MTRAHWVLSILFLAAAAQARASTVTGSHPVLDVKDGGVLLLNFNGLPIQVRLAHLKMAEDSLEKTAQMLKGQSVRLEHAEELQSDEAGRPMVYVAKGGAVTNIEIVRAGLASYDASKAKSARYDKHLETAEASAKREKLGMWSGEAAKPPGPETKPTGPEKPPPGGGAVTTSSPQVVAARSGGSPPPAGAVYSELRSSQFHAAECRYTKRISANSIIVYASAEKAEQAGKHPCWTCLSDRAEKSAFGSKEASAAAVAAGKLVGLKSDQLFHSPVCARLKKASRNDMVGFQALEEARTSGRQACFDCLRLRTPEGAPPCTPEKGECIGRSPPYFRPCMRAPADASGLCPECLGRN